MVRVWCRLGPIVILAACGGGGAGDGIDAAAEVAVADASGDGAADAADGVLPDADVALDMDADGLGDADAGARSDSEAGPDAVPDADTTADADAMPDTPEVTAPVCGNGVPEATEACDQGLANSDTKPDACRSDCTEARCGDGVVDTGESCDDGDDDPLNACTPQCVPGPGLSAPTAGSVIFTELMINPTAAQDPLGEWIELWNVGSQELSLSGCVVFDSGTDAFPLTGLVIPSGGHVVLAFSGDLAVNGGVEADLAYGSMLLDNLSDEVVLQCGNAEIDRVEYSDAFFPIAAGKAMSLDPAFGTAKENDGSVGWCVAVSPYGAGDLGTPGFANPACVAAAPTVDSCRLASPPSHSIVLTESITHGLEIFEPGVTTKGPGVDAAPGLRVQLGLGALGSQPADGGFTWVAAVAAPDWADPTGYDGYLGTITPSATGSYDVAGRVSLDLGQTWVYCDLGPLGSDDGYQPADAVMLEVGDNPCDGFICDSPPGDACDAAEIRVLGATAAGATCEVLAGEATCIYPPTVTDCGALGAVCLPETASCGGSASSPDSAGQLVFSEFLADPLAVADAVGFWVEIYNPGESPLDLEGCAFSLGGEQEHVIDSPLVIGAGDYRVLADVADPAINGGVIVDHVLSTALDGPASGGGALELRCGDVVVDSVVCPPGVWPIAAGKATALSPFKRNAVANDSAANWCTAVTPFGAGDLGTPGGDNPPCPGDIQTVDTCRIQPPSQATLAAGTLASVSVRLRDAPLTFTTPGTDTGAALSVEVGYGPAGTVPDASWTWLPAEPDSTWSATAAGAPAGTDAWNGRFTTPPAGEWAVVFRVSVDAGHSASICDTTGLGDGFLPAQAWMLTSEPSACDPDPCSVAPGLACDADEVVDLGLPAACALAGDGAAVCAWTATVQSDCAALGGVCADGGCEDLPLAPIPGQVIFTELAIAPGGDERGEWLELTNVSEDRFITLSECALVSGSGLSWPLAGAPFQATLLRPGASKVFARSGDPKINGGLSPAAVYAPALALPNDAGSVSLVCGSGLVDTVKWDDSKGWSIPVGVPLSLAGNRLSAAQNDLAGAWCPGLASTAGKPAGSPGAANPLCPPPDAVVDFCRFESPESLEVTVGESFPVAGLITDFGNTNLSPGVDAAPGTRAQVGVGATGADAQSGVGFVWFEAAPDPDWEDPSASLADRWIGEATALAPGAAALAVRFSLDGGATWLACDLDGSDNGYSPSQAGVLTVKPSPCSPNPCDAPPTAGCDGDVASVGLAPGACTADEAGGAVCEYEQRSVDCAPHGGCAAGDCVLAPPGPKSAGDLVITEVMRRSGLGTPDAGEWFEVLNTTEVALALDGCRVSDASGALATVIPPIPLLVAPGGRLVLGASADPATNGGVAMDFAWGSKLSLGNVFDEITLRCGGVIIDRVVWVNGWPGGVAVAMQTRPEITSASGNDAISAWCAATSSYGPHGLLGTPGLANTPCP